MKNGFNHTSRVEFVRAGTNRGRHVHRNRYGHQIGVFSSLIEAKARLNASVESLGKYTEIRVKKQ